MKNRLRGFIGVLVFLGILIAANALISQARVRKDFTKEGLYTLSAGTKQLLGSLQRDVTLKFYYSKNVEGLPMPLKQYAQRILDLLHEYEVHGGGHIALEVHDPEPDSDDEEWAQRYGVTPQNLGAMGINESLYLGLVTVSGAKEAAIPFFSPSQEPQLEYLLTRMISEVTAAKKSKIGVMSTLPVMGLGGMSYMQRGPEPWIFVQELKNQYDVVQINPAEPLVPEDIDTVLVIHPKALTDPALFALDQFVLRGGRLVAFMDASCVAEKEVAPDQDMSGMMNSGSDLNKLTQAWGLEYSATKLVTDSKSATRVRFQDGRSDRNPTWLSLRSENLDKDEIATASLEIVFMPFAGAFTGTPAEDLKMTTLIKPSSSAGLVDALSASMGGLDNMRNIEKSTNALALAVRLTGRFVTAFPNGVPGQTNAVLKASKKEGVVVLVGDVDMLYDRFAAEKMNFFGRSMYQLSNDNIAFVLNIVEQLSGNPALIGLRSRGSYERPFNRVVELEEKAQTRWREEELKLQDKLEATQARLAELQNTKDSEQKFVLSPEQQREIEQFRKDQFETKKQLKQVRKNLRGEIEALGLKLKATNIALIPALIAILGVAHGLRRRQKASR